MLTTSALFAVDRLFIKRLECWPVMRPRADAIRASGFKAVGSTLNPNARASLAMTKLGENGRADDPRGDFHQND
jgi:hypothetical protein